MNVDNAVTHHELHRAHCDIRLLCAVRTQLRSCWWFRCRLLFCFEGIESPKKGYGCSFVIKCLNTQKSTHPPVWQACKVLCPWALFHKTTVVTSEVIRYPDPQVFILMDSFNLIVVYINWGIKIAAATRAASGNKHVLSLVTV